MCLVHTRDATLRRRDLGVAAASKSGKPPAESAPRVRATRALRCIVAKASWWQTVPHVTRHSPPRII